MTAEKYIQEHIHTMVGEHHVSSMELTTLISLLNGYASQSKWVSVEKGLPEMGEVVIGYFPNGDESGLKVNTASLTVSGKKVVSNFPNSTAAWFEATHWQPLPDKPVEKS